MSHFKKPNTLLTELLPSLAGTALLLIFMAACGGSAGKTILPGIPGTPGTQSAVVASHIGPSMRAYPAPKGTLLASLFMFQSAPAAAALAQSFEGTCAFSNNPSVAGSSTGAHGEYGNSGFVALNVPNFSGSCGDISITGVSDPVSLPSIGAGDTTTPRGWPVFTPGTISAMVASAFTRNGKQIFCRDTISAVAVTDGHAVLPYLSLADNSIVLGSGNTTLATHCQLQLAAGDDILTVSVSAAKD